MPNVSSFCIYVSLSCVIYEYAPTTIKEYNYLTPDYKWNQIDTKWSVKPKRFSFVLLLLLLYKQKCIKLLV